MEFRHGRHSILSSAYKSLTNAGKAEIRNVVTDPATGSTYLDTAQATLDT